MVWIPEKYTINLISKTIWHTVNLRLFGPLKVPKPWGYLLTWTALPIDDA